MEEPKPLERVGLQGRLPERGGVRENFIIAERFWESLTERVKSPYAKW